MSEEHRWNGENEENKNTADNSQETENRKDITGEDGETHGYYQINRNSSPEGTSQDSGTEESQNVTYHYSYRNQNYRQKREQCQKDGFSIQSDGSVGQFVASKPRRRAELFLRRSKKRTGKYRFRPGKRQIRRISQIFRCGGGRTGKPADGPGQE